MDEGAELYDKEVEFLLGRAGLKGGVEIWGTELGLMLCEARFLVGEAGLDKPEETEDPLSDEAREAFEAIELGCRSSSVMLLLLETLLIPESNGLMVDPVGRVGVVARLRADSCF